MGCDPFLVLPAGFKEVSHCWTPPRSRILALGSSSHFRCVLAESPGLAGLSRAHSLCPCVPLSFSPGSVPAKLALSSTPGSLPSSPPRCVLSSGFHTGAWSLFPSPAPKGAVSCPALGAVFAGVRCREGGTGGQERGWLPPLPQG